MKKSRLTLIVWTMLHTVGSIQGVHPVISDVSLTKGHIALGGPKPPIKIATDTFVLCLEKKQTSRLSVDILICIHFCFIVLIMQKTEKSDHS